MLPTPEVDIPPPNLSTTTKQNWRNFFAFRLKRKRLNALGLCCNNFYNQHILENGPFSSRQGKSTEECTYVI
jgi:hypothetical protein